MTSTPKKVVVSAPLKESPMIIPCDYCGISLTSFAQDRMHFQTVHHERNYKCEFCEKSFIASNDLKVHIKRIHDCVKDINCESCSKLFSTTKDMKEHTKKKSE